MDSAGNTRPPGTVLCRGCYNFRGMQTGPERRRSGARLCAAGVDASHIDLFGCESYVPMTLAARIRTREGSRPPGSGTS